MSTQFSADYSIQQIRYKKVGRDLALYEIITNHNAKLLSKQHIQKRGI